MAILRKPLLRRVLAPKWDVQLDFRQSIWQQFSGEQIFVASFIGLILTGTLGLKLIPGLIAPGQHLSWLDALFTIVSAVCVTGLQTVDFSKVFTLWGQAWVLLFIQLGGLGVIALSSVIIMALGGRLSLRSEAISGGMGDVAPKLNRAKLIRDVLLFTLLIECIGAIALFLLWKPYMPTHLAAWHSVFHSVSAFCNAGFSTFGNDNLMKERTTAGVVLVIGGLIVLGGIGFLSMEELYRRIRRRRDEHGRKMPAPRVSLHTKLVFWTTIALLLVGWAAFALFEWTNPRTLGPLDWWDKLVNSLFMSITPRTAGFNTIDYGHAHASTNFFTIILMSVGGSPGSTAGGLKTTTVALIALLAWSRFRRRHIVSVFDRTIPEETLQRAVGLFVFVFGIVTLSVLIMITTENRVDADDSPERLLPFMFECASAFNTVGLSMNVTPTLSDAGKWNCIFLMFLGRVGPLTFAAAIALSDVADKRFRFAKEDVVVG
jgi:trk system potassium uptake protein TrkH